MVVLRFFCVACPLFKQRRAIVAVDGERMVVCVCAFLFLSVWWSAVRAEGICVVIALMCWGATSIRKEE